MAFSQNNVFVGPMPLGTLTLINGNLSCEPYDCHISLLPGQTLSSWGQASHIFQLKGNDTLTRYYFYSNDIAHIPAYSGQPIGILIGVDSKMIIRDTRLIEHDEPILLAGIPIKLLKDAIASYQGKSIAETITLVDPTAGKGSVDLITGATVTSLVVHETILNTTRIVANQVGLLKTTTEHTNQLKNTFTPLSWGELLKIGAIGHLIVYPQDMGLPKDDPLWLDLYFADLFQPTIGINLLGKAQYELLLSHLKPHQSVLMIVANGTWNFKGSAFVRGGIFDRFHIEQNLMTFGFRDTDYAPLYGISAKDAPNFSQSGLFIITAPQYDRTAPWNFTLLASQLNGITAVSRVYKTFQAPYYFPKSLMIESSPMEQPPSLIKQVWLAHWFGVSSYLLLWTTVMGIFCFRRKLAKNKIILERVHLLVLCFSIAIIGLFQHGQPSVVNIFTFFDVLKRHSSFSLFFLDPYLAIGWIMIIFTIFFWGRSLFCGWICPFGALQELLYKMRIKFTRYKHSLEFSDTNIRRLRLIRFGIFLVLLGISFYSLRAAEIFSEIEPFKTTWNIGLFNRLWPYGLYVLVLLILGGLSYRFFCRFLCPLGAGLAFISFFPLIPLPRRKACVSCRLCYQDCEPHAISKKDGHINAAECLGCFECVNKLDDKSVCPPLINKKIWDKFGEKIV